MALHTPRMGGIASGGRGVRLGRSLTPLEPFQDWRSKTEFVLEGVQIPPLLPLFGMVWERAVLCRCRVDIIAGMLVAAEAAGLSRRAASDQASGGCCVVAAARLGSGGEGM